MIDKLTLNRMRLNTKEVSKIIMNKLKKRGFDHDITNDITYIEFIIANNIKIKEIKW